MAIKLVFDANAVPKGWFDPDTVTSGLFDPELLDVAAVAATDDIIPLYINIGGPSMQMYGLRP